MTEKNETVTLKTRRESEEDSKGAKERPHSPYQCPHSLLPSLRGYSPPRGGLSPPQPGAGSETYPTPVPTTILTLLTKTDV